MTQLRFGVQTAPEQTTWEELRETWKLVDALGYDTCWTSDHFLPIMGEPSGACFEGWTALTALLAETSRVEGGVLVTGNSYRHPAVLAKMAATADHASGGRLLLGLGAGWFELEHDAYGIPFETTKTRIDRFEESVEILTRLFTEEKTTFDGKYYQLKDAYCVPKPVRKPYPPIVIGAAGEKRMLRLVAQYADIWNTFGDPALFRHKIGVLRKHCANVGRDPDAIEVSWAGPIQVTDSASEKDAALHRWAQAWGTTPEEAAPRFLIGSASELREKIQAFAEVGVTHFIGSYRAPYDRTTIQKFAENVVP